MSKSTIFGIIIAICAAYYWLYLRENYENIPQGNSRLNPVSYKSTPAAGNSMTSSIPVAQTERVQQVQEMMRKTSNRPVNVIDTVGRDPNHMLIAAPPTVQENSGFNVYKTDGNRAKSGLYNIFGMPGMTTPAQTMARN